MKSNFPIFSLVVYAFSVISKTSRYFKALSFNQKKYPQNENMLLSSFACSIPKTTGGGTKRGNQLINFLVL